MRANDEILEEIWPYVTPLFVHAEVHDVPGQEDFALLRLRLYARPIEVFGTRMVYRGVGHYGWARKAVEDAWLDILHRGAAARERNRS